VGEVLGSFNYLSQFNQLEVCESQDGNFFVKLSSQIVPLVLLLLHLKKEAQPTRRRSVESKKSARNLRGKFSSPQPPAKRFMGKVWSVCPDERLDTQQTGETNGVSGEDKLLAMLRLKRVESCARR
jgi:hypothetical protein